VLILFCVFLSFSGALLSAQNQQVTPAIPQVPSPTPIPDDARLNVCTGPTVEGFRPHIIRAGEDLGDLLQGLAHVSVTQIAALNCIDDPTALPVGAVIWLPENLNTGATVLPSESGAIPSIREFTVSAESVTNVESLTFSWEAEGRQAFFYACPANPELACKRPLDAEAFPLTHSVTVQGFTYAGPLRYQLEVTTRTQSVTEALSVEVTCAHEYIGQINGRFACPQGPALDVYAAWQPFQGGVMMWFEDTGEIWVMTNHDQRIEIYADSYVEGSISNDVKAPETLFTPQRGFGVVWRALGGAESPLGWAVTEEIGFGSARQPASARSYTYYVQGPGETRYAITLIPQVDVGYWAQIEGPTVFGRRQGAFQTPTVTPEAPAEMQDGE
jgi:hypothetical protein